VRAYSAAIFRRMAASSRAAGPLKIEPGDEVRISRAAPCCLR
jgi:hypothetical protein